MEDPADELTPSEENLTYYPIVRPSTLGDLKLSQYCPLAQHRAEGVQIHTLGRLERLPHEVLDMIWAQLDFQSLMTMERVNRRAFDTINAVPQIKAIMRCCADAIRASLIVQAAPSISCLLLFQKLSSSLCECCGDFGGYLYVLTCTRLCYLCFTHHRKYLPILKSHARNRFGLSAKDILLLPHMKSVPGQYTILDKNHSGGTFLIDAEAARQMSLAKHGIASSEYYNAGKHIAGRPAACDLGMVSANEEDKLPGLRALRENVPGDHFDYNPKRFMAIIRVPFIDTRNRQALWGFHCLCCRNEVEDGRHFQRQFLASGFRHHLLRCGKIVNEKHVGTSACTS